MDRLFKDRRGILEDVFDYLFLILVGIFMLLFLGNYLNGPLEAGKEISLKAIAQFHYEESAIQNLRVQEQDGLQLDPRGLDHQISASKVLGGRVITSCSNYISLADCSNDPVGVSSMGCTWNPEISRCNSVFREPTEAGGFPGGITS